MAKPKLQKRRLLKLAAYLEALPQKYKKPPSRRKTLPGFDMGKWIGTAAGRQLGAFGGRDAPECGTLACAIGHATRIPEFRALGFKLHMHGKSLGWPEYKQSTCFYAVAAFFGTTYEEASALFSPSVGRHSPTEVAQSLRHFVKTREVPL